MVFHKNRMLDTIADINKHETAKTGIEPAFVQVEILKIGFVIIPFCNLASLRLSGKKKCRKVSHPYIKFEDINIIN